jgi:hypothetical protein
MSMLHETVERLEADYGSVKNTLESVGLTQNQDQRIPSFDAVAFHITSQDANFLTKRAEAGLNDRLIIAPNLGELTLTRLLETTGHYIVDNGIYNERFTHEPKYHNRRNNTPAWSIGVVLNDTHDSKDARLRHAGLVLPGLSFERQKTLAALEKRRLQFADRVDVQPVTIQEQIIGQMTYPKQTKGTTRLIHLPTPNVFLPKTGEGLGLLGVLVSVGGHPGAPEISGHRIDFTTSSFHKGDKEAGVRRVLLLNGTKELNVLGRSVRLQLPRGN